MGDVEWLTRPRAASGQGSQPPTRKEFVADRTCQAPECLHRSEDANSIMKRDTDLIA